MLTNKSNQEKTYAGCYYILNEMPTEWLEEIGEDQVEHAKAYVLYRVTNLPRIYNMTNHERGGT